MSEERRSSHNIESDESDLLLSVEPISARSPDSAALNDDTDATDTAGEDTVDDTVATDAGDTDTTDDADGTD